MMYQKQSTQKSDQLALTVAAGMVLFALLLGSRAHAHPRSRAYARLSVRLYARPRRQQRHHSAYRVIKLNFDGAPSASKIDPLGVEAKQKISRIEVRNEYSRSEMAAKRALHLSSHRYVIKSSESGDIGSLDYSTGSTAIDRNFGTANDNRMPASLSEPTIAASKRPKLSTYELHRMMLRMRKETQQALAEDNY